MCKNIDIVEAIKELEPQIWELLHLFMLDVKGVDFEKDEEAKKFKGEFMQALFDLDENDEEEGRKKSAICYISKRLNEYLEERNYLEG